MKTLLRMKVTSRFIIVFLLLFSACDLAYLAEPTEYVAKKMKADAVFGTGKKIIEGNSKSYAEITLGNLRVGTKNPFLLSRAAYLFYVAGNERLSSYDLIIGTYQKPDGKTISEDFETEQLRQVQERYAQLSELMLPVFNQSDFMSFYKHAFRPRPGGKPLDMRETAGILQSVSEACGKVIEIEPTGFYFEEKEFQNDAGEEIPTLLLNCTIIGEKGSKNMYFIVHSRKKDLRIIVFIIQK